MHAVHIGIQELLTFTINKNKVFYNNILIQNGSCNLLHRSRARRRAVTQCDKKCHLQIQEQDLDPAI